MNKITILKNRLTAHKDACSYIQPMNICLDIGCGINPQSIVVPEQYHHIADPHEPYLEIAKRSRVKNGDAHVASWEEVTKLYPEKSVDTIFLVDVIEHLEKEEGEKLLPLTVKIAKKQVFIFTPYGFMPQPLLAGADPWDLNTGGNKYQVHRSGWLPKDFINYDNVQIFICYDYHKFENRRPPLLNGTFGAMWVIINNG